MSEATDLTDQENVGNVQSGPRVRRRSGQDLNIGPGSRLILQPAGTNRQLATEFVGMVKDKCLITLLPGADLHYLVPEALLTVKCVQGGHHVSAFRTNVRGTATRPVGLLFLEMPSSVESIDLRQADRVHCFLPASTFIEGGSCPGLILDLSVGGCRLVVDRSSRHPPLRVKTDSEIVASFRLFDENVAVLAAGVVRNLRKAGDSVSLGIQFSKLLQEAEDSILDYVKRVERHLLD